MAAFNYTALDKQGSETKGVIEADSVRLARQSLRGQGLTPLTLESVKAGKVTGRLFAKKTMSTADLSLFTRQLATLLNAGLPLEECLTAVAEQTEKDQVKSIILGVRSKVLEGYSLATGLAEFPKAFAKFYRATIAAGEESGHLDVVLERLADYTEKQFYTKQKIQHAMIYPAIMTIVSIGIVSFLMVYVVPKMINVFATSKQALPVATQALLSISNWLQAYGIYALIILIVGFIIFRFSLRNTQFRFAVHQFILKMPFLASTSKTINTARFARTFGILSSAGVPVVEAMSVSAELIQNMPMKESVLSASMKVREGANISLSLKQTGFFPAMSIHLIASGENSGKLEEMLERAADNQERDVSNMIDTIMALFEPMLILVMGAIVLFIVLAILLPIFSLDQFAG